MHPKSSSVRWKCNLWCRQLRDRSAASSRDEGETDDRKSIPWSLMSPWPHLHRKFWLDLWSELKMIAHWVSGAKRGKASAYLTVRTSSAIFNERSFRLQLLSEFRGTDYKSLCIRAWLNESHVNVNQCQLKERRDKSQSCWGSGSPKIQLACIKQEIQQSVLNQQPV